MPESRTPCHCSSITLDSAGFGNIQSPLLYLAAIEFGSELFANAGAQSTTQSNHGAEPLRIQALTSCHVFSLAGVAYALPLPLVSHDGVANGKMVP